MDSEPRDLERVRVAVRVRPRNAREEALEPNQHVLDVDATDGQIYVCKKKFDSRSAVGAASGELVTDRELRCSFDRVFAASATQDDVFDYVRDAVQQVAQGFNCTIFAYGQTGTGKTHTMLGRDLEKNLDAIGGGSVALSSTSREAWGVIPRAVESLFEELTSIARHGAAAAVVHCSYMQIYNNEVYDLLQENRARMKEPLAVREMIKGNDKQVFVSGLSEFRVASLDETLRLLKQGNRNRTVRATEYNEKSSRSHALLQLSAEVESRGAEGPATIIRRAKLSLVDLAGSEKWATGDAAAMGADRCKELTSINQSLSALGNVISALANPRRTHVPYRDAKLTRLLQDSLGGNTRTTVLATISPDASAIEETISTLLFAERAKCVALRVKVNEVVDDAVLLAQARREIARLTLLLKKNAPPHAEQLQEFELKLARLMRENAALVSENKRLKQQAAVAAKRSERDKGGSLVGGVGADPPSSVVRKPSPSVRRPQEASPRTPADEETRVEPSRPRRPSARTLVVDEVGKGSEGPADDEVALRARQEAHDQSLLLEQIQSERRALEQELERLEQQTPRRGLPGDNNGALDGAEDEDACPICRRNIDDHTDDELDACIERETAAVQKRESTPETSPPPEDPSRLPVRHVPTTPRTPPPARKPTTPRATGSVKKPASPYLQDLFSKAAAAAASPSPTQLTLRGATPSSSHRRSVRDLAQVRQSETGAGSARESEDQQRPSTADAHAQANGSSPHQSGAVRSLANPIVHQGSKSVKALKKFQATSPYNSVSKASATKAKPASGSPPRQVTMSNNNSNGSPTTSSGAEPEDRVVGSLRDIGLLLMVYKFRYDCWYPCTVVGFDSKRRLHCCQYEYGDKQWQDLAQNKIKLVGRSGQNQ